MYKTACTSSGALSLTASCRGSSSSVPLAARGSRGEAAGDESRPAEESACTSSLTVPGAAVLELNALHLELRREESEVKERVEAEAAALACTRQPPSRRGPPRRPVALLAPPPALLASL